MSERLELAGAALLAFELAVERRAGARDGRAWPALPACRTAQRPARAAHVAQRPCPQRVARLAGCCAGVAVCGCEDMPPASAFAPPPPMQAHTAETLGAAVPALALTRQRVRWWFASDLYPALSSETLGAGVPAAALARRMVPWDLAPPLAVPALALERRVTRRFVNVQGGAETLGAGVPALVGVQRVVRRRFVSVQGAADAAPHLGVPALHGVQRVVRRRFVAHTQPESEAVGFGVATMSLERR